MKLDIIFEDSHILVINKPSGLVVNNSKTSGDVTVQNLLVTTDEPLVEDDDTLSEFSQRGGIVHRIDKDTSGVLVIAKDEPSFKRLQKQFKRREVTKMYVALVDGILENELIEIDAPIARNPNNRMKYAVVSDGKEAQTKVEKIKTIEIQGNQATLLNVYPKTGRTHQIRVHLSALGHQIIGDSTYRTKSQVDKWSGIYQRLMLHANSITFRHPETGEEVTFNAPLPEEFMI